MTNLAKVYTDAVYGNLAPLRANWEPGQFIDLGAYGLLNGNVFSPIGNVGQLGIAVGASHAKPSGQKTFSSSRGVVTKFSAKGTIPQAKAELSIGFDAEGSSFFNAADCVYRSIADKAALGTQILAKMTSGDWDREWVVVTELVDSKSTTVVISQSSDANIVFEAAGNVGLIDLADATLNLTAKSMRGAMYTIVTAKKLTPLIVFGKVQKKLFSRPKFKPLATPGYRTRSAPGFRRSVDFETEELDHFDDLA